MWRSGGLENESFCGSVTIAFPGRYNGGHAMRKSKMNRRQFIAAGGAAGLVVARGSISAAASAEPTPTPALMKLGCQSAPTNDVHLKYFARYGVRNICGYPEIEGDRLYATVDELKRMMDMAAKYGISIDCIAPPFLESSFIDQEKHPAIMLAQSPERDRDIEQLQTLIKNCGLAGIPCIKYNMSILGILRTGRIPGRGDAMNNAWNLAEARPATPLTRAGHVDADAFWERITYFLDRVIPAANEYKIRMACHPQDPGVPPEGYQGVNRVLGTVDGLRKFIAAFQPLYDSMSGEQKKIADYVFRRSQFSEEPAAPAGILPTYPSTPPPGDYATIPAYPAYPPVYYFPDYSPLFVVPFIGIVGGSRFFFHDHRDLRRPDFHALSPSAHPGRIGAPSFRQ